MNYLKTEIRKLGDEIRKTDFKTSYIFISVSVIIFISIAFASPNFFYEHFGRNRLNSRIYWFLTDGLLMFLLPVLSVKLVFRKSLKDFGFSFGDVRFGLVTSAIFYLVMFPVIWIVSASPEFASTYPQGGSVLKSDTMLFIFYEFCILIYMLGWEFLWRGYMLFGLREKFGVYAIFIQMIPFFILHKGKPELELFGSIFAGLILGIQALRSNSFIYCWLLHWLIMLTIDTISVIRSNLNYYSIF